MKQTRSDVLSSDTSTNKKVLQGQATLARILVVAREAFIELGYAATTTAHIIEQTGLTKGALYHHFASKRALFEAVYLAMEEDIANAIRKASTDSEDPWQQLVDGCHAYLNAFIDPEVHRVMRVDGPAALGYERWAEIDQQYGLQRLLPFLQHLQSSGVISVPSVEAFARVLTGAMNEATFWIAEADDPAEALAASEQALSQLLEGVRA